MLENLFDVKGKVALVTGGAKGLGAMMTQGLVEAGVKVYVSSRSAEACENFATKMRKTGACEALPMDLSTVENCEALAKILDKKEEKLDILINNSGMSWGAPLADFPENGWDRVMDLNVKSLFFLTKALLPLIKAAGSADDPSRIINISSIAAVGNDSLSAYSYGPSKAAVNQLTRLLANELVKEHVLVNAIAPGFFPTKMTSYYEQQSLIDQTPLGRIGRPTDIAGLVLFLCSKAGSFMTGNYIPLDGGYLIK
ncbi:MAG: SDR family oxidoreductase [Bacteroidota bacterium]